MYVSISIAVRNSINALLQQVDRPGKFMPHANFRAYSFFKRILGVTEDHCRRKKLAVPGYPGVLGFHATTKQVYWDKGNWFESSDPDIYSTVLFR
ncbi:hypothetical protein [Trinickia sp. Y13]|uniref:hypothetical protein n=1 Tax=Trinickia sp. Y13 TaxID=2917807 RepID=UPI002404F5AA|nr:hypothetical protein [Trinickia sp. Y13]MDG0027873.1 hypothetical protein [Trinickia sp. Y13]